MHVEKVLNRFEIPLQCIYHCTHIGDCGPDVTRWRDELDFTVDRKNAIEFLATIGEWTREELVDADDIELAERVLWMACADFRQGEDALFLEG